MCYQPNPKMTDEDVVDKVRDGLLPDMFSKMFSDTRTSVNCYADLIIANGAIRKETLVRGKFATLKSFTKNVFQFSLNPMKSKQKTPPKRNTA